MARVVLLHYAAPPVVGGVENVVARQAELLVNAGHQVTILTGRGEPWDTRIAVRVIPELDSRHPRVLEIKKTLDQGAISPDFYTFRDELVAVLNTQLADADDVIAHNVASLHKNLPLTAALYQFVKATPATRVILWHHDFAWNSRRYRDELHAGYPWDLLKTDWPEVHQVTISEARKQEMCALYQIPASRVRVIANGIDPAEFFNLQPGTRELVETLKLNLASPLLLTPVRLTRRKNLEFGMRIVGELIRQMPSARWVITGPLGAHNPENLTYYQQLTDLRRELGLADTVVFLADHYPEGLSDDQVADFYNISDALLITSQEEGFGLPIIEAGLTRLNIFTTDLPPLRALGGDWVTYFRLKDPPAVVAGQIVERLAADPVYRLREHIRANYTWDAIYVRDIAPLLNGRRHAETNHAT